MDSNQLIPMSPKTSYILQVKVYDNDDNNVQSHVIKSKEITSGITTTPSTEEIEQLQLNLPKGNHDFTLKIANGQLSENQNPGMKADGDHQGYAEMFATPVEYKSLTNLEVIFNYTYGRQSGMERHIFPVQGKNEISLGKCMIIPETTGLSITGTLWLLDDSLKGTETSKNIFVNLQFFFNVTENPTAPPPTN